MNVIFDIFPSVGHQQATYKLAKLLQERGDKVIYIGEYKYFVNLPDQFERHYIQPHFFSFIEKREKNFLKNIKIALDEKKTHKNYKFNREVLRKYDELFKEIKPDVILLDHHYIQKAILYYSYKIPVISIQTAPASNMGINIPPFNSSYIPSNNITSKLYTKYLWTKYLLLKRIRNILNHIIFIGEDHLSEVKKLAKETGFPLKKQIDFNHYKGYGEFGLKNIPQLLLSPRDFDFPHELKKNQYAIGPLFYVNKEEIVDNRYLKVLENLLMEKKIIDTYIIYCSLGTLNDFNLKNSVKIFQRVIEIAKKNDDFRFILSIGDMLDPVFLLPTPDNVFLFKSLPQKHLLTYCDMMIAHGGQNSITECIMNEVPILIYPFFKASDLQGNSARVVFHGIGNRGDINKDTLVKTETKIKDVLFNSEYRVNIHKMKLKFIEKDNSKEAINIIQSIVDKYNEF